MQTFITTYNTEVDRWHNRQTEVALDDFVLQDDTKIKWSRNIKRDLKRSKKFHFTKIMYYYHCIDHLLIDIFILAM